MSWKNKALNILHQSLNPVPTEKNEIDWKTELSPNTTRLVQHLCAFSNNIGGGVLVFGVNDDGVPESINKAIADEIVSKLANIAKNNLEYPINLDHDILDYEGKSLLFVHIPEQVQKPMKIKGRDPYDCYCRSAGTTNKMSRQHFNTLTARSQGLTFERQNIENIYQIDEVLSLLNYNKFFELLDKRIPLDPIRIIDTLVTYDCCVQHRHGLQITNLGALLFANDITNFPTLKDRGVIVRKYAGSNNRVQEFEQPARYGYAVGFEGLIAFILKNIPTTEVIDAGARKMVPVYPAVAIRELVATALIHQDFDIHGIQISIEIFSNRICITNPGTPLNSIDRLIDLPARSRNELMAEKMFILKLCERRGSGMDRAVEAIEKNNLPPIKIAKGDAHTSVTLFPPKKFAEMSVEERILACYQHTCLLNEDAVTMTNQSLRARLSINKNNASMVSRVINDTLTKGLIKNANPDNKSTKMKSYIPYYV